MNFRSSLLFCCLLAIAMAPALTAEPGRGAEARLRASVDAALEEQRLAGMAWSLVSDDRTEIGAAGRSNMESGAAMGPGQRVHVGSIAKTLVALGLLRLVTEGRLDLNSPVSSLLPEIRFSNRWEQANPVRVRHLLDHTAGFADLRIRHVFSARLTPDDPLLSIFADDASILRVRTRPGETFSYSNISYVLAGAIMERITGMRYEEWLDANLLAPLEMSESTFRFVTHGRGGDPRLAWGHQADLTPAAALPVALRPAGQFTTTAEDMARLARFMMSDGRIGDRSLVNPALLRAMGRPTGTAAAQAGLEVGNGLGIVTRDRYQRVGLCHSGDIVGYRAIFCIFPEQRKAFFYSINTDGDGADYGRFDTLMMDALALPPRIPAAASPPPPDASDWNGTYIPLVSRTALARYPDWLAGGLTLEINPNGAVIRPVGGSARELSFAGGYLLRAADRTLPSHALLRSEDGTPHIGDHQSTQRRITTAALWMLRASLAVGLAGCLYLLLATPILGRKNGGSMFQPGAIGPLLILIGAAFLYLQPFERLGDLTPGSFVLFIGSLALPIGAVLQAVVAFKREHRSRWTEIAASLAVAQWSIVLASFGLLPLVLWA